MSPWLRRGAACRKAALSADYGSAQSVDAACWLFVGWLRFAAETAATGSASPGGKL